MPPAGGPPWGRFPFVYPYFLHIIKGFWSKYQNNAVLVEFPLALTVVVKCESQP